MSAGGGAAPPAAAGPEAAPAVASPAADATLAAAVFAIDPAGFGGVRLRAPAGPARDAWLARLRDWLPPGAPWRRIPLHASDARLLGGLDLGATLAHGRRVAERGLLAEADGGVALLAMAERAEASACARLAQALDAGEVAVERDGIAVRHATRFGVVALDEGLEDEAPPGALLDRLAFEVRPDALAGAARERLGAAAGAGSGTEAGADADGEAAAWRAAIARARPLLARTTLDAALLTRLVGTALALGVPSLRAAVHAARAARALAALRVAVEAPATATATTPATATARARREAGALAVTAEDAALAARLVLAPRATQLPTESEPEPEAPPPEPPPEQPPPESPPETDAARPPPQAPPEDLVLAAALAAIPPGLLARLQSQSARQRGPHSQGRSGVQQRSGLRGRPAGVRRGLPRPGLRLHVVETLRAAAPWQRVRRREAEQRAAGPGAVPAAAPGRRLHVRTDDFHVARHRPRAETTTIFVVDASGSSALARLAEAKGAVELLLADCYVRRDRVAVIAFRERRAELLLPPTRSLVRAKRSLAALPGGGGTPLATGLDAAVELAAAVQRRGGTPTLVLLTDGRANVARDGAPGRPRAAEDALAAARRARAAGLAALLIDTATRPDPAARRLAEALRARYVPLPHADARAVDAVVRGLGAAAPRAPR